MGIGIAAKPAAKQIARIPGRILIKINQVVGFGLITKAGTKGVINLTKMLPLVGGGIDHATTVIVAKRAIKNFFDGDFSDGEEIIEVDVE